jgi:hypothetical protein
VHRRWASYLLKSLLCYQLHRRKAIWCSPNFDTCRCRIVKWVHHRSPIWCTLTAIPSRGYHVAKISLLGGTWDKALELLKGMTGAEASTSLPRREEHRAGTSHSAPESAIDMTNPWNASPDRFPQEVVEDMEAVVSAKIKKRESDAVGRSSQIREMKRLHVLHVLDTPQHRQETWSRPYHLYYSIFEAWATVATPRNVVSHYERIYSVHYAAFSMPTLVEHLPNAPDVLSTPLRRTALTTITAPHLATQDVRCR